jgi:protein involved in polysaccharide export with SLBB domain
VGEEKFTAPHIVTISGIVVAPGQYPRGEGMRLSELIRAAGGFKPGGGTRVTVAHAYRPQDAANGPHVQVAMSTTTFDAQGNRAIGDDVALQDGDVVGVQGDGSLKPRPTLVTITGAVNRPGGILLSGKMRLSDAVRLAGGLRPEAFPQGAEFSRDPAMLETTGQRSQVNVVTQLNDLLNQSAFRRGLAKSDLDLIQAAQNLNRSNGSPLALPGASAPAGAGTSATAATVANRLSQRELVSPARILDNSQLQPTGFVAVHLAEALRRPGGSEDIPLLDGDTLVVPETPTTVQVVGAVFRPGGALFKPGQSIGSYVRQVGGYTPDAALDRIEIVHLGGGLIEADKAGSIQPGDLILVPTKVLAEKLSRGGFDIGSFFQALTGSLLTLRLFR